MEPVATERYVISLRGNTIVCRYRQEPQVRITMVDQQGVRVQTKLFREVFRSEVLPFFTAIYSTSRGTFQVDLDCGAQRWVGRQSVGAVRKALMNCGLSRERSLSITVQAKKPAEHGQ